MDQGVFFIWGMGMGMNDCMLVKDNEDCKFKIIKFIFLNLGFF